MMSEKQTILKFLLSPKYHQDHKNKTRWVWHVALIIKMRNAYKLMVRITKAKSTDGT